MEREVLENAFAQALDELNAIKKSISEQSYLIKKLTEKSERFDEKLEQQQQKVASPSLYIHHLKAILTKSVEQIQTTIIAQPKNVIRQFKILLFPEQNASEYYRLVFGRLLFWMMIFLTATYLVLGKQFIENWTIVKEKQLEKTQIQNAWNYLYQHETKQGKKKMEAAWQKSK